MNKPNNKRFQKTESRIVECTLEFIERFPDRPLTVTAICEAVPVNRTSFYLHHKSVQSVMDAIMAQYRQEFQAQRLAEKVTLSAEVRHCFLFAAEHQSFYRYYIRFSEAPEQSLRYLQESVENPSPSLPDSLTMTELQYHYLAVFMQAGVSAAISHWLSNGKEDSVDEIVELFTKMLSPMDAKKTSG
ncbi:MAG: TetR family transcriptional regulator C-terminal domain-containing protein [Oscillospiraceae bacterium]|nr:TetR family transcriptional regulator C-terminal domain-containing protein [Oscillospiraceae bacterium]